MLNQKKIKHNWDNMILPPWKDFSSITCIPGAYTHNLTHPSAHSATRPCPVQAEHMIFVKGLSVDKVISGERSPRTAAWDASKETKRNSLIKVGREKFRGTLLMITQPDYVFAAVQITGSASATFETLRDHPERGD